MVYSCERCGYTTDHKKHMIQHLQRKNTCNALLSSVDQLSLLEDILNANTISTCNACNFCGKEFASRQGKSRHHKICKQRPELKQSEGISIVLNLNLSDNEQTTNSPIDLGNTQPVPSPSEPINTQSEYISNLLFEIEALKEKKTENFYQHIVEKYLGGTHKVVKCGITDVSTDTTHAEIKTAKEYKAAIGQLVCYNFVDKKPNLHLYLFGKTGKKLIETAKELCAGLNIDLFMFKCTNKTKYEIIKCDNNEIVHTFDVSQHIT